MKKQLTVIVILVCVLMLCACSGNEEVIIEDNTVETPYTTLTLPEEFEDNVTVTVVSEDPYTLSFTADDGTELFTLCFGGEAENLLGTLDADGESIAVYASFGELDSDSENYETYCGYQAGINKIISGLTDGGKFVAGETLPEDDSTFDIETSVVTMKYPAKWKDIVNVEVTEDAVKFSTDGTPLFDLLFYECDGFLLGTYKGTPIYIVDYDVSTDEQAAMQQDVNVILEHLMKDPDFIINN